MVRQLLAIGRTTCSQCLRQPVMLVLVLVTVMGLILCPSLAAYTLDDDNKLLVDMGLSTLFVSGLFMAVFASSGALSSDVQAKTLLNVISKARGAAGMGGESVSWDGRGADRHLLAAVPGISSGCAPSCDADGS